MADVTVKRLDKLESYHGQLLYAGRGLGVTAWGMNVLRLAADGQTWDLVPGTLARVGAGQKRTITPGPAGVTILALGGTPGKAYEPPKRLT